jgi:hypothetical protein
LTLIRAHSGPKLETALGITWQFVGWTMNQCNAKLKPILVKQRPHVNSCFPQYWTYSGRLLGIRWKLYNAKLKPILGKHWPHVNSCCPKYWANIVKYWVYLSAQYWANVKKSFTFNIGPRLPADRTPILPANVSPILGIHIWRAG